MNTLTSILEPKQRPAYARRYLSVLATLVVFLTGSCTTVQRGVSGTEQANLPLFADRTVALFGVYDIEFRAEGAVLIREFADDEYPDIERLTTLAKRADRLRDRVIGYSLELVRIARLPGDPQETPARLADSIEANVDTARLESIGISEQTLGDTIEAVRGSADYLAALRAAQPFVDALGAGFEGLVMEIEESALPDAVVATGKRIDAKYARLLEYMSETQAREQGLLHGLTLLERYRAGDTAAMETLIESGILIDGAASSASPGAKEAREIRQYLIDELRTIAQVNEYIKPDIDRLQATRIELRQREVEVLNAVGIARIQMLTWNRAYQFMASGVKNPGEWFKFGSDTARVFRGQL